ncbi:phage portal protein [Hellea sp.]|nr:phage portal protein [Hellea sp.]
MKNLFRGAFGLASKPAPVPESKSARPPLIALSLGSRASWTPRDYGGLVREGYQKNAIVYRCVRLISEAAASVPLCVRRGNNCEAGDPAETFLSRGNPMTSAAEVMESFYGYLQVGGNAYMEAALVDGVPSALYALRPDRVSVVTGRDGWPSGYDYEAGGYKRRFRRDAASGRSAVHHMRLFHPASDSYGFSPLEAAAQAVDVHNEGGRWAKALLDNSARPSGALIYKGGEGAERLSDDAFDRLKLELEGQHSGARHAGRPMVLEGGLDWKAMSLTPSDMDFIEARREAAREIALAFGVPPMLLGIPGDNTYANYKEANQAFWRQTIIPLVRKTARGMEDWLQPFFGEDLRITADLDSVPALSEERGRLWKRLGEASFLTDEERRDMAGLAQQNGGPT